MANVLIVDDEEADRVIQKTILEDAGHRVFFAQDGEAALKVYASSPVDVVITDLKMPRLNGLRLIEQLKELDPNAMVLAVSGVSADQLDLATEMGAARTLFKPLEPSDLVEAIEEALNQRGDRRDGWGSRK